VGEILTVQEVADYLKVSRSTVWRWCNEGKLLAFKAGRGWRVHRLEVEKMVGYSFEEGGGKEAAKNNNQNANQEDNSD
jgi:excisionase family DNA binding protein